MKNVENPFEYDAANKLGPERILDFYIEDHNYSRFIRSRRNVFLVGERGTGKSMALLYNSFPIQVLDAERRELPPDLNTICIYVGCNTPITHKKEYELLEEFQASIIGEHFLVLSMMYALVDSLSSSFRIIKEINNTMLLDELEYIMGTKIDRGHPSLDSLKLLIEKENSLSQQVLNGTNRDAFFERATSFASGFLPLITCFRRNIPSLCDTHFSLMIDDAHNLNIHQMKTLNSWIAFRDNTVFSFKVATAKVNSPTRVTATGGSILEGHDFILIDMEQPYQNRYSDFGMLSRKIIERRLERAGINKTAEEYFPTNPQFEKEIEECRQKAHKEAEGKYPNGNKKQINDYVYKYTRAIYFRDRDPRANLPAYSGIETLVHVSTGVIRNLLEPCYWMFDKMLSEQDVDGKAATAINRIEPSVQTEILIDRSKRKWEWIQNDLDISIEGCSKHHARLVYQLFDNLAILFRERLLHHRSEPRAIAFTISETNFDNMDTLMEILSIARKAQILYEYRSSAKNLGKRETYYVPNRILWLDRGLDPVGQHARVSIKARSLWTAASENLKIPFDPCDAEEPMELFNEKS